MKGKKVVVGMSGGVDSSVAALLLKEQGYEVIGLFMKNWNEEEEDGYCPATEDYEDVVRVCHQIGIPHYSVDFSKEYWDQVFAHCLEEYRAGWTPNPDILCNREIKFKVFFERAMRFNADFLATGHYCQKIEREGEALLAKGLDPNKDQSYFLYAVKSDVLQKVLFPLGGMRKEEVRKIAEEKGLVNAKKKDSTGICFVGKRDFRPFLQNYIPREPGKFETPEGKEVGEHQGIAFYTIGQRKGLGIGGPGEPWFVVGKDVARNVVIVVQGEESPQLYSTTVEATDLSWVGKEIKSPFRCAAKIRYRQPDAPCTITKIEGERIFVTFDTPQKAVTPRQSLVLYDGNICLGGGMIAVQ